MGDVSDEALPAEFRDAFEDHLACCRHCSLYASQLRVTIALCRRLGARRASADVSRRLLERASAQAVVSESMKP